MTLKVIGAGFGRTGTMSMKMALEQLGTGKCHHMEEVFENPWQLPKWQDLVQGKAANWDALLDGYSCSVDWPSAHFWRELYAANAGAKVVLTTRPVDDWWASYSETIMGFMKIATTKEVPDVPKAVAQMCVDMIGKQTFGSHYQDEVAAKAAYEQRLIDVKETIPEDDLLIYKIGSGWSPLCEFLAVPEPEGAFPRSNERQEFWQNFNPNG